MQQSRIRQGKNPAYARPAYKRWHRPRSTKRMTVELERPFAWPEEPEDLSAWNRREVGLQQEEQEGFQERQGPTSDQMGVPEERSRSMREQARALLEGRVKWRPAGNRGFLGR